MTAKARSGPPADRPAAPAPPPPPGWRRWLIPIGVGITALLLLLPRMGAGPAEVGYGQLSQQVAAQHVESLTLTADGAITGTYRSDYRGGEDFVSHYPTGVQGVDETFLTQVKDPAVVPHFSATGAAGSFLGTLLSFLPILLFLGYFLYIGRM